MVMLLCYLYMHPPSNSRARRAKAKAQLNMRTINWFPRYTRDIHDLPPFSCFSNLTFPNAFTKFSYLFNIRRENFVELSVDLFLNAAKRFMQPWMVWLNWCCSRNALCIIVMDVVDAPFADWKLVFSFEMHEIECYWCL